jgi:hypothetical protein
MAQHIKEFGIINENIQNKVIEVARKYITDLQPSQLYSSLEQEKFIDLEERSSKYTAIVKQDLFEAVEKLIKCLNEKDKYYDYKLVRNDVTYIEYGAGDFFKAHEDYLSYTSNVIEEFTLLMCVDANCEGGRTIFHVNDYFTHKSDESRTPLHCVVFRKDLKHEGELLKSGTKSIITLNLLAIPKSCDRMVVIKFTDSPQQYFLSENTVKSFGENLLAGFLNFSDQQASIDDAKNRILLYDETMYTYDQFQIIYQILSRCYISIEDYKLNKAIIDYYQIDIRQILLTEFHSPKKPMQNAIAFEDEVILNETPEQTQFMIQIVKDEGLPYIPFTIVLGEGALSYGGGMSDCDPRTLAMSTLWLTFGECNNIMVQKSLRTKGDPSVPLSQIIDNDQYLYPPYFTKFKQSKKSFFQMDELDEEGVDDEEYGYLDGTDVPSQAETQVVELVANEDENDCYVVPYDPDRIYEYDTILKWDLHACKSNLTKFEIINSFSSESGFFSGKFYYPRKDNMKTINTYFSINEDGKLVLIGNQCYRVVETLKKIDLEKILKAKLATTRFNFPQEKATVSHNFCNESVYGHCNLFFLTGFLRVDEADPNQSSAVDVVKIDADSLDS